MPKNPDTAFFGHPSGLSTLFFTEMWERFSFYGLRAILILFMTAPLALGGLGWGVERAGAIYGTYAASVYLMSLPGGWVADKVLGLRRSVFWGGVLIMCGQLCLAIPHGTFFFYPGLIFIALGTGMLKPNISALVGQLYTPDDVRRDAGFSIYYMGINVGATFSPLICGWLAQGVGFQHILAKLGIDPTTSWHFGFGFGALGMSLGLLQYVLTGKRLGNAGLAVFGATTPEAAAASRRKLGLALGGILVVIAILVVLSRSGVMSVTATRVSGAMDFVLVGVVVGFFAWLFTAGEWTSDERKRLVVILVLFLAATVFWSAFEQAASTLNLFAQNQTRNTIFGISYPASWLQSVNALLIIVLAPVAGWVWVSLGRKGKDPSTPAKFSLGLFFLGTGFAVMILAATASASGQKVSPLWLVLTYFLHTVGELCLSPVGLSAMTRLAPARVTGLMMGVWFLATSVGNKIAGTVAGLTEKFSGQQIFGTVTVVALLFALILALLVRPIKRMMAKSQ
ncbi:MAG TPA: peptide MFS transporter [Gemmatimonadales bacterium]|nr:peptide MFS transporter [Gemmatimonadales bacterium]